MLLRIAAFLFFIGAAFEAFGWFVSADALNALGLIALGLAAFVLSGLDIPYPAAR
jgi:hypothetical protein